MRQKLSNRLIQDMSPGDTYWDTSVTGLGIRCQKRAKSFVFKYRADGRQKLYTIGRFGPVTLDQARRKARTLAGEVAADSDPAASRDAAKAIPAVREAAERFLAEHVEAKRKAKTAYEYRRLMERHILPAIGDMRIDRVARRDVARMHDSLRETPHQANRVLAVTSKMMSWCEARGFRPEGQNPTRHIEKFSENRRERFLSEMELAMLGETLGECEAAWLDHQEAIRDAISKSERTPRQPKHLVSPFVAAAIRLLIFSGARVGEILTLRWEDVDQERGLIFLPDSKTGQKPLIVAPPMAEVLAALPRLEGNPYVIAGGKPGAHLADLERPWRRVRDRTTLRLIRETATPDVEEVLAVLDQRTGAEAALTKLRVTAQERGVTLAKGISDVRLHDLRHTFASYAAGMGHSLPMIGRLLGHSQPATTARYAHLAHDPVQQAAADTSTRIANLMTRPRNGETSGDNVAHLKGRKN